MRMDQRQMLTPRMIQSMEILQMPLMALEERVDLELQSNPVLDQRLSDPNAPRERTPEDLGASSADNRALSMDTENAGAAEFDRLNRLADYLDNEEFSTNDGPRYRLSGGGGDGERDRKLDAMNNTAARGGSLAEHLLAQWSLHEHPADFDFAGKFIIQNIDGSGYLKTPLEELQKSSPRPLTIPQLSRALALVQQLEPAGVGARTIIECLLLQLDVIEEDEDLAEGHDLPLERALVRNHLEDLRQNRFPLIAKQTGREIDAIKRAVRRLSRLSPHPGKSIAPDDAPPITPDAEIILDEATGRYEVKMRNDQSDSLFIRKQYRQMLANKAVDKSTRDFLAEKVRSAKWLMESLVQRRSTIARVIRVVVDTQRDFFELGPEALKPLPMVQVADQLGIHVATVSRAVSEKYIQTPIGIFPLRRFFTGGTTDDTGKDMSWDAVKEKLKHLIDEEDKKKPLADDILVKMLKEQGITLARRTVAKYRGLLNIPTARQRVDHS